MPNEHHLMTFTICSTTNADPRLNSSERAAAPYRIRDVPNSRPVRDKLIS
jgi:hypothetical protein